MRFFISTSAGVTVAFALFLLMSSLISDAKGFTPKERMVVVLDIFQIKPDQIIEDTDDQPPDEPEPVEELDLPTIDITPEVESPDQVPGIGFPVIGVPVGPGGIGIMGPQSSFGTYTDGDAVPIVLISPRYPRDPLIESVEGWVELEFTVTENGEVTDAVVTNAQPNGVFNRVALQAIYRSKFKPRVVDGVPTAQRARQRYDFTIEPSD